MNMWKLKGTLTPLQRFIIGFTGFLVILSVWQAITSLGFISRSTLPEPLKVAMSYPSAIDRGMWDSLAYSIKLNFIGMGEAVLISVVLGFLIGLFAPVRAFLGVYIQAARYLPLTAIIGLMITWFGIYDNVKIQFLAIGIMVYMIPTVASRVQETLDVHLHTAQTLGASSQEKIWTVFFPDVLRRVSTDIISLVAISWTYIVIAEYINNTGGIGAMIEEAGRHSRYEQQWALVILIIMWAFVQDMLLRILDWIVFPDKYKSASSGSATYGAATVQAASTTVSDPNTPAETCKNVVEVHNVTKTYKGKRGIKWLMPIARELNWMVDTPEGSGFLKRTLASIIKWLGWADALNSWAQPRPDVTVLKDVELVIANKPEGEFAIIMGASGCGKSTLLRFLANLDTPTSGEIFVNGLNTNSWMIRLGMVFQEYSSFPWLTVLDNVALGLKYQGVKKAERRHRAMEMIKRVGLEGHEMKYARKPTLSGGQLQRVAIARSLLANPQVLLLDEPFGALDVKTRAQLQDLMCSIFEEFKPTVVLVTHAIDEAVYLADDIYIMCKPPAKFVHHIKVDLGLHRDRHTKRMPEFIRLTQQVEDIMMTMEG